MFGRWIQCGIACDAEEKIDGANLGISVDTLSGAIRFQKRGHWIAPSSEPQYGKLEAWSNNHKEALSRALGKMPAGWQCGTPCPCACRPKRSHACVFDPRCIPASCSPPCLIPPSSLSGGTRILYGEWLCARHTVAYDKLPDWFVAFDIFDVPAGRFLSRRVQSDQPDQMLLLTRPSDYPASRPPQQGGEGPSPRRLRDQHGAHGALRASGLGRKPGRSPQGHAHRLLHQGGASRWGCCCGASGCRNSVGLQGAIVWGCSVCGAAGFDSAGRHDSIEEAQVLATSMPINEQSCVPVPA